MLQSGGTIANALEGETRFWLAGDEYSPVSGRVYLDDPFPLWLPMRSFIETSIDRVLIGVLDQ